MPETGVEGLLPLAGAEVPDWAAHRRWLLTANLRRVTRSALVSTLGGAFGRRGHLVDLPPGVPLDTVTDHAFTDVAWLFADLLADVGDTRRFLLDAGEADPGAVGTDRSRSLAALRRLLAVAAVAEADDPEREYFAETVTRLLGVFMGLHLSWPTRLTVHGPALVSGLLELTDGWALRPASLGTWRDEGFAAETTALHMPERALLVARAACHLEQTYAEFYGALAGLDTDETGTHTGTGTGTGPADDPADDVAGTTPDPMRRLVAATDRVLDVAAAGWEEAVATAPHVLAGIGTTTGGAPGGLDLGLQVSFLAAHHFLARPGPTPARVAAYQTLVDTRWSLTLKELAGVTVVDAAELRRRAASTSVIPQCRILLEVFADADAAGGTGTPYAPALARAMTDLAEAAVRLDDAFGDDDLAALNNFRLGLALALDERGLDADPGSSPHVPRAWHPAMTEYLRQGEPALRTHCETLAGQIDACAAVFAGPDDAVAHQGRNLTAALVAALVSAAEPEPPTFAVAAVLHELTGIDRGAIWSRRGMAYLGHHLPGGPDALAGFVAGLRASELPLLVYGADQLTATALWLARDAARLVTPTPEVAAIVRDLERRLPA
jgi:hypothetical protein